MRVVRLHPAALATTALTLAAIAAGEPTTDHRAGSLAKDEPQAVYAADPADPWNRIFYCLFTRTVPTRLADGFPEGKPFDPTRDVMGFRELSVSRLLFERIEGGDRAIDPLYPSSPGFTTDRDGANRAMAEPLYSRLKEALEDARGERRRRPPLARALMQGDLWAAHDVLSRNYNFAGEEGRRRLERRNRLRQLLAQLVKKLALTPEEIRTLPDTYAAAAGVHRLPDLFGADSAWWEVRWSKERIHDFAADYRRVARVFIKPAAWPHDGPTFLNGLRQAENFPGRLNAVALVTQDLLIDSTGKAVQSPLTYEVQLRTFVKDGEGRFVKAEAKQYELSRRRLLDDPRAGGFVAADDQAPAYLPDAGNDYGFASVQQPGAHVAAPILVRLGTRCTACHGQAGVLTFSRHEPAPLPPVTRLRPSDNEQARYVIGRKASRKDFQALRELWNEGESWPPERKR